MDATGSYSVAFWVFGGIFAFSGLMCVPLRIINNWEKNRKEAKGEKA